MHPEGDHDQQVYNTEADGRWQQKLDIVEKERNVTEVAEKYGNTEAESQHNKVDKAQNNERNVNVVPEQSDVGHANSFCCSPLNHLRIHCERSDIAQSLLHFCDTATNC